MTEIVTLNKDTFGVASVAACNGKTVHSKVHGNKCTHFNAEFTIVNITPDTVLRSKLTLIVARMTTSVECGKSCTSDFASSHTFYPKNRESEDGKEKKATCTVDPTIYILGSFFHVLAVESEK